MPYKFINYILLHSEQAITQKELLELQIISEGTRIASLIYALGFKGVLKNIFFKVEKNEESFIFYKKVTGNKNKTIINELFKKPIK